MAQKLPWVGTFNINNEKKEVGVKAYSRAQAELLMARKIAWKDKKSPAVIMGYLKSHPESYEIKQSK
ncbi:MAG: hypothetical protein ABFD76_04995 [Smithella sp.]